MSINNIKQLRAQLLTNGQALNDAEMLGVVLGSPAIAQALLRMNVRWWELSQSEIRSTSQFGPARAAQVLAIAELARRIYCTPIPRGRTLQCSEDVASAYGPRLCRQKQELFIAISLDCRNRVIAEHEIAKGSLTSVEVHAREVFRPLIRDGAASTILTHNHPSGDPSPSADDRSLCHRLCEAGAMIGIAVLDFVVLGDGQHVSFADEGWLGVKP